MLSINNSSLEDLYVLAGDNPSETDALLELANDLKEAGVGSYNGEEFVYRRAHAGMEVVSMQEFLAERE